MTHFAKRMKELRAEYNMNQDDMANSLGVSVRTLRRWESGERMPLISHVKSIIDMYYVDDVYELVYGPRKKPMIEIPKLTWM